MKFLKIKNYEIKRIEDLIILKIPFEYEKILPGQFFMIGSENSNVLLNRPFSVSDYDGKILTFRIKKIGKFTNFLGKLNNKSILRIIGPCGNGLDISDIVKYDKLILIGGGIGIAPLIFFKNYFKKKIETELIFGIPSKKFLYFLNDIRIKDLKIYTEDGSYGIKGYPTDYLKNLTGENILIIACGPIEMYKSLLDKDFDIKVLMEQRMGCGFGACLGCVINTIDGYKRVCIDGPIFDLKEIKWE